MKTSEKVAFIKGLMEGLSLEAGKPETKILNYMVEVLEELAASNNALIEENIKLKEYVEELDSDLGDLEEYVYDADSDFDADALDDDEDGLYGYETFGADGENDDEDNEDGEDDENMPF